MKNFSFTNWKHSFKSAVAICGLSLMAVAAVAQDAPSEDGVIGTCTAQGNANDVCICASLMLHARLGDQQYARFGEISDRISEIAQGAEAGAGEMDALTNEGFRYFVPHGQAISVCKSRLATGG